MLIDVSVILTFTLTTNIPEIENIVVSFCQILFSFCYFSGAQGKFSRSLPNDNDSSKQEMKKVAFYITDNICICVCVIAVSALCGVKLDKSTFQPDFLRIHSHFVQWQIHMKMLEK